MPFVVLWFHEWTMHALYMSFDGQQMTRQRKRAARDGTCQFLQYIRGVSVQTVPPQHVLSERVRTVNYKTHKRDKLTFFIVYPAL